MYEDQDLWPFKCIGCLTEFTANIGWLETSGSICCPDCYLVHQYSHREFLMALAKARKGEFNPFTSMIHVRRLVEPGPRAEQ